MNEIDPCLLLSLCVLYGIQNQIYQHNRPLHQPNDLVPYELLPKHQNTSSLIWVWWDKDLAKRTSQEYVNGEGESRGIWRIKWWRLWMSQSYFSLRFLSQNSLWNISTFRGYKDVYSSVCEECEKLVFIQTGYSGDSALQVERVASLSHELTAWLDCTFCPVVLQLSWSFNSLYASHVCHFGDLPVTS